MPIEQDIEKLRELVKEAEDYTGKGVWEPQRHEEMALSIIRAENILNWIITRSVDLIDITPALQAFQVSGFQERIQNIKQNLPSPPPGQVDKSKTSDKKVVIYITPS
ncbi:hypothetical protein ACFLUP_01935 [Chloroflexota bacterium]